MLKPCSTNFAIDRNLFAASPVPGQTIVADRVSDIVQRLVKPVPQLGRRSPTTRSVPISRSVRQRQGIIPTDDETDDVRADQLEYCRLNFQRFGGSAARSRAASTLA